MLGLGIEGDAPPNTLQPALPDGMHLRWAFEPTRGFPWFGYYLFRRESREKGERVCVTKGLRYEPGTFGPTQITANFGDIESDRPLFFTDDFAPAGQVELDLDHRRGVTYRPPSGQLVRGAFLTIGFPKEDRRLPTKGCADFRDERPAKIGNPANRSGISFVAIDKAGQPRPSGRVHATAGIVGWDLGASAHVDIPAPVKAIELDFALEDAEIEAVARDSAGRRVDKATAKGAGPQRLTLQGHDIVAVDISAKGTGVLARLCWRTDSDSRSRARVEARYLGQAVAFGEAIGTPGQVVNLELWADAIDEVVMHEAQAALIELCVVPFGQDLRRGWQGIENFRYPLCLPVAQADYPCPDAPTSTGDAENLALGRISYGSDALWAGAPFAALHDRLERLVVGGPPPGGDSMYDRTDPIAGNPAPPAAAGGSIRQRRQRALDLILVGSLQPAVAQMVGLYWWDKTAAPGVPYDYLLVADHDGSLGGTLGSALAWLASSFDFTTDDGFIAFNRVVAPATPLSPPAGPRAFALPGSALATNAGAILDATNNAGLTWDTGMSGGVLPPDAPVLYHVWRADLGNADDPAAPAPADFSVLTEQSPVPVSHATMSPPQVPPTPGDWPPVDLSYIDRGLSDGWFAYQVSGIDLFGRHSANSTSAEWRQWTPAPSPKPWYYVDPPADRVIDPVRVRLLDKLPPPAPAGVEAFALDPDDPTVLQDAAWQTWRNSLSAAERASVVGLRVRWQWTPDHQRQAPDTREFRVYYQPSPLNTLRGRVTAVAPASASESFVTTDLAGGFGADTLVDLSVRIGADSYRIIGNDAATPLRLRVKNIGPTDAVVPGARKRCAIALLPGYPGFVDLGVSAAWAARRAVVPLAATSSVDADGTRRYELFLPIAGSADRAGLPLAVSLDEPLSAAAIGVTAADDKAHTPDARGDAARFGNESRIGGPATVFRLLRQTPPAPVMPPDSAKVFASRADYHGTSYYTFRWLPAPHLRALPHRALDDGVFQADLARRPRAELHAGDAQFFPDAAAEPAWTALKRQEVASELNTLNALNPADLAAARVAYGHLSNDGLRVLAGLPGTERAFVQLTTQPVDPDEPDAAAPDGLRWRRVGPDVNAGSLAAGQRAFVDGLDGHAANRYFYRVAYIDEVHNVGPLGLSSPPVWLPDVTPPRPPAPTRVVSGDRSVTLEWASNREPDLAEYRVYRTDREGLATDIRTMSLVHTVAADPDPAARPATVGWTDTPVPGLRDLWYRLVAVDRVDPDPRGGGGNPSQSTAALRARAYDESAPESPAFSAVEWVFRDATGTIHPWADAAPAGFTKIALVRLRWPAAASGVRLLLQLQAASDGGFAAVSGWLAPGTTEFIFEHPRTVESQAFRLKALSEAGNVNTIYHPTVLAPLA
jgi:hypothetical protein